MRVAERSVAAPSVYLPPGMACSLTVSSRYRGARLPRCRALCAHRSGVRQPHLVTCNSSVAKWKSSRETALLLVNACSTLSRQTGLNSYRSTPWDSSAQSILMVIFKV